VKFIGNLKDKNGIFYGIDLTKGIGKNLGDCDKIQYFQTKGNRKNGRFVQRSAITKVTKSDNSEKFTIGDQICIPSKNVVGTIRYVGIPQANDKPQYGVALTSSNGNCDGKIKNIAYFTCLPKHGLFIKTNEAQSCSDKKENSVLQSTKSKTMPSNKTDNSNANSSKSKPIIQKPQSISKTTSKPSTKTTSTSASTSTPTPTLPSTASKSTSQNINKNKNSNTNKPSKASEATTTPIKNSTTNNKDQKQKRFSLSSVDDIKKIKITSKSTSTTSGVSPVNVANTHSSTSQTPIMPSNQKKTSVDDNNINSKSKPSKIENKISSNTKKRRCKISQIKC